MYPISATQTAIAPVPLAQIAADCSLALAELTADACRSLALRCSNGDSTACNLQTSIQLTVDLAEQCENGDQEACPQLDALCNEGDNDACRMKTNIDLKGLCEAGNNGACNELYTRCEGGDAQACQALPVNKLGEKCQEGYGTSYPFNAACRELLRRCNQGNNTEACLARRTCNDTVRRDQQDIACSLPTRCRDVNFTCPVLSQRMMNINSCIDARQQMVLQCFQGVADIRHQAELDAVAARYDTCITRWDTDECTDQGLVAPTLQPPLALTPPSL